MNGGLPPGSYSLQCDWLCSHDRDGEKSCVLSRPIMSKVYTYIRRHLALAVVTSIAGLNVFAVGNEGGVIYKNISEVKARYKLVEGAPLEWMGEVQGAKTSVSTTMYWGSYGQYWKQYSRIPVGTIVALPLEDFQTEATFSYRDAKWIAREGKLISVTIGIFAANKSPSPTAKMRAVKNLCEAGAAIPRDKGRPGRILALKSAAKRRFGAKIVDVYYDDNANSKVRFLLQDCRPSHADDTVTSLCYEGTKKQDQRAMVESNTIINKNSIRRTR